MNEAYNLVERIQNVKVCVFLLVFLSVDDEDI